LLHISPPLSQSKKKIGEIIKISIILVKTKKKGCPLVKDSPVFAYENKDPH
jgi:hypothetical protein